jgi:hypothetical protein
LHMMPRWKGLLQDSREKETLKWLQHFEDDPLKARILFRNFYIRVDVFWRPKKQILHKVKEFSRRGKYIGVIVNTKFWRGVGHPTCCVLPIYSTPKSWKFMCGLHLEMNK